MFLKKTWNKLGVSNKLFFTTLTFVVISTVLVYTALYLLFPKVYIFYKSEVVDNSLHNILQENSQDGNIDQLFMQLNMFSYNNNVDVLVKNSDGIIFLSSKFLQRISANNFSPQEQTNIEQKFDSQGIVRTSNFNLVPDMNMQIEVRIPTQPIQQIQNIMLIFLPIVMAITILIAIISSYFYSKAATRPLLKINDIARSMAKLDFSKKFNVEEVGDDELAELARSLNYMSSSLEKSIRDLEKTNRKLVSDIEKERLAEKKRREFVATISHELKSPITIISGQLEGMIYNIGAFKDRDKYLKKSYDVIQDMRELVLELLEINKYESEAFKVEMEKINLSVMLKEAMDKKAFYLKDRELDVNSDIEENICVYADMKLIKKVLDNIISNAIKYTESDDPVKITLECNEKVELVVENHADNISDEDIEKIFTPFYRIEKSRNRKTGGSGLGLYIVKNILDKHSNMNYNMEAIDGKVKFSLVIDI